MSRKSESVRLLVPDLRAGEHVLTGDAAHHALRVVRVKAGARVELFNGSGGFAGAEVLETDRSRLTVRVGPVSQQPAPPVALTVALAIPKGDRADWAVEKLTELGVVVIQWLVCERSVTDPSHKKLERFARKAAAAAAQCGRADVPDIVGPVPLVETLSSPSPLSLIAHPGAARLDLVGQPTPSTARVLIGPEGGFSGHELAEAEKAGYTTFGLGSWTLRVETAAVAAAARLLG